MEKIISLIYEIIWSPLLVIILLGTGIFFTIRTRFVQIRKFPLMVKLIGGGGSKNKSGISSFQALCIAVSGCVGTGNIVGVATAIATGGPGSIFWMWIIAILNTSVSFVESTLGNMYRFKSDQGWRGGPANYISEGLGKHKIAILFAICTIIGYGMLPVMVQANGISTAFENSFHIKPVYVGTAVAALLALIICGGIKRIANVATIIAPFMAGAYFLMSLIIVGVNYQAIPGVLSLIVSSAFGMNSVFGGILGSAIMMGVKRGIFSNEAGEGGGAMISANAEVEKPACQGLVQALTVYIDTLVVCTATAMMILCTGSYNVFDGKTGEAIVSNAPQLSNNYVGFTQAAVDSVFSGFGSPFVAVALFFFAFSSLMAYYVYAETSIIFLATHSKLRNSKTFTRVYRVMIIGLVILGTCTSPDEVWTLTDIGVGLTTWINIIALWFLFPKALESLKEVEALYAARKKRK